MGSLKAEAAIANGKKLMGFLGDRLGEKSIELTVESQKLSRIYRLPSEAKWEYAP